MPTRPHLSLEFNGPAGGDADRGQMVALKAIKTLVAYGRLNDAIARDLAQKEGKPLPKNVHAGLVLASTRDKDRSERPAPAGNGYSVEVNLERGLMIVRGAVPLEDLPLLAKLAKLHGMDRMDCRLAETMKVTMVVGSKATCDAERVKLGLEV